MQRIQGSYALIQFSPVPERMEFLNVGVVLAVPELRFLDVRFANAHSRIDRFFKHPKNSYLNSAKESLGNRLRMSFERNFSLDDLEAFAAKRANELRISPFLPVAVSDPDAVLDSLFLELVGEDRPRVSRPRMHRVLKEAFERENVERLLDQKPSAVDLPDLGISIKAPYGYQNGAYNFIDGMHFGADRNEAMKEAGKRALEGNALAKLSDHSDKKMRLSVVADFSEQPQSFYDAVGEQLEINNVRLYRLDKLSPLLEDIKKNSEIHGIGLS